MEIHRYEKIWIVASIGIILFFIATIVYGSVVVGIDMVDDSGGTIDPENISENPRFSEPGVVNNSDGSVDVYMVARQFSFQPDPVKVPANTEITFHVTSADVIHGYHIVGSNVNTMVIPGQISEMTVVFDQTGEHGVVCNEYCGVAHHTMEGTVNVIPESEWGGQ